MATRLLLSLSILFCSISVFSQGIIKGHITDNKTKETLIGVTVKVNDTTGTLTDISGNFKLEVPAGKQKVTFSFVGYQTESRDVNVATGESNTFDIPMQDTSSILNTVVISGSKRERAIAEEAVTIDVLKSDLIKNSNNVTLAEAVDKIPGVEIFDNQVTIRGGSGYAFGAGSRVLLLLDDMPLLTVDRSEIKWNFIPLEITDQVEVSKSAASALYGASALNGIINVRTGWVKDKPETEASVYYTKYGMPKDSRASWWGNDNHVPLQYGGSFLHKHRIGQFDIVASFSFNKSIGYIRLLDTRYERVTLKMRYRSKKIDGLSMGINTNMMESREGDYLFWSNDSSGAYIPYEQDPNSTNEGSLSMQRRYTVLVDPWISYFDKHHGKHILRGRYNHVYNIFGGSYFKADAFFGEYQYQHAFDFGLNITAGVSGQYYVFSNPADFGEHNGNVLSSYLQLDQKVGRFNFFVGVRYEHLQLDTTYSVGRPVGSAGINFRAGKASFLRASFGQGYRFPSIAERFVDVTQSGIHIYPNPDLKPEYGFNAELGLKQGFKIGSFQAYFDASFFWMEYWDMTEFTFGVYAPNPIPAGQQPLDYIGFKALNVNRARIAGYEVSLYAEGKIGKMPIRWQGGYTYNYAVDLNNDSSLFNAGKFIGRFFQSIASKSAETLEPMLKYRSRHIFKNDIEVDLWRFTLGADVRFYGFVEKVDPIFESFIRGLKEYRAANDHGAVLLNLRLGFTVPKYGKISFIVNNATNSAIAIRPARMEAPINFVVQYRITI